MHLGGDDGGVRGCSINVIRFTRGGPNMSKSLSFFGMVKDKINKYIFSKKWRINFLILRSNGLLLYIMHEIGEIGALKIALSTNCGVNSINLLCLNLMNLWFS